MLTEYVLDLKRKYVDNISDDFTDSKWATKVFLYYQYLNGDDTNLDELTNLVIDESIITSIVSGEYTGDGICMISELLLDQFSKQDFMEKINEIDKYIIDLHNGNHNKDLKIFKEMTNTEILLGDTNIDIIIIDDKKRTSSQKKIITEIMQEFNSKVTNIEYIFQFAEDVIQKILDVENPVFAVTKDFLETFDKQVISHGEENSLLLNIKASSLKRIFLSHGTKGLFSSNLRYYVKSSKIDSSIKETIINEPENFWYFNNGIIITCEDYTLSEGKIELSNFSIVNGGQTTNLIGTTDFIQDFPIVCKVIKTKYEDEDSNINFLSKVAETSNTQKPIRAKDLIANRVEQRKLRKQLSTVDVFLQIKRGEKINRKQFPEPWQNAKNDELGQMLFSFMYQHPGISRNSKSKMLENESYYNKIYRNDYSSFFLVMLQHFKVGYNHWKRKSSKESDVTKVSLSKYSQWMMYSIFGLLIKLYYNKELNEWVENIPENYNYESSKELRDMLSQNDVGFHSIISNPRFISDSTSSYYIYNTIYNKILEPAYSSHKKEFPYSSYAGFTKNDTNYYRHIVPLVFNKKSEFKKLLNEILDDLPSNIKIKLADIDTPINHLTGLGDELKEYRTFKFREANGRIKAYEVFTNKQMSDLAFYKPKTKEELTSLIKMKNTSVSLYGEDILNIIKKYFIQEE